MTTRQTGVRRKRKPGEVIESMKQWTETVLSPVPPDAMPHWHLFGATVPEPHILAGSFFQIAVGPCRQGRQWVRDHLPQAYGIAVPLLGSWDHRPTIDEKNAVLPPDAEPCVQADNEDEYGDVIPDDDYDLDDEDDWNF